MQIKYTASEVKQIVISHTEEKLKLNIGIDEDDVWFDVKVSGMPDADIDEVSMLISTNP